MNRNKLSIIIVIPMIRVAEISILTMSMIAIIVTSVVYCSKSINDRAKVNTGLITAIVIILVLVEILVI